MRGRAERAVAGDPQCAAGQRRRTAVGVRRRGHDHQADAGLRQPRAVRGAICDDSREGRRAGRAADGQGRGVEAVVGHRPCPGQRVDRLVVAVEVEDSIAADGDVRTGGQDLAAVDAEPLGVEVRFHRRTVGGAEGAVVNEDFADISVVEFGVVGPRTPADIARRARGRVQVAVGVHGQRAGQTVVAVVGRDRVAAEDRVHLKRGVVRHVRPRVVGAEPRAVNIGLPAQGKRALALIVASIGDQPLPIARNPGPIADGEDR